MRRHATVPKKLHEALRLALDDVDMLKDRKDVEFYMDDWYFRDSNSNVCYVCLAGAVMFAAKEERGYSDKTMDEKIFHSKKWHKTLTSLNLLRVGHLHGALIQMHGGKPVESLIEKFYEQGDFKLVGFYQDIEKGRRLDRFVSYLETLYGRLKAADL